MLSTISSANTVAECSTPAGCSPASSIAATRRSAVPGSAMSPVITSIRPPSAVISAIAARTSSAGPERPLRTTSPAPSRTSHCAKTKPRPPMPPTTMYPPSRRTGGCGRAATASILPLAGIEMTILPVWLPEAISRKASIAFSRVNSVTGSTRSAPSPTREGSPVRARGTARAAAADSGRDRRPRTTRSWPVPTGRGWHRRRRPSCPAR